MTSPKQKTTWVVLMRLWRHEASRLKSLVTFSANSRMIRSDRRHEAATATFVLLNKTTFYILLVRAKMSLKCFIKLAVAVADFVFKTLESA